MHQATMQHVISETVSLTIHQPWAQATFNLMCWSFQVLPECRPLQLLWQGADLLIYKCCTGTIKGRFADALKGREECFCPQINLSTGSAKHSLETASCNKTAPKVVRAQCVTEQHRVWPSGPSTFLISGVVGVGYGKSTQIILRRGQPLLGQRNGRKPRFFLSGEKIPT